MKKLTTLLLSAAMILSLAGCGGKQDPKEIYDAAAKKAQELTSVDASYVLNMKMVQGEETMDMSMDMNMKMDLTEYIKSVSLLMGEEEATLDAEADRLWTSASVGHWAPRNTE